MPGFLQPSPACLGRCCHCYGSVHATNSSAQLSSEGKAALDSWKQICSNHNSNKMSWQKASFRLPLSPSWVFFMFVVVVVFLPPCPGFGPNWISLQQLEALISAHTISSKVFLVSDPVLIQTAPANTFCLFFTVMCILWISVCQWIQKGFSITQNFV